MSMIAALAQQTGGSVNTIDEAIAIAQQNGGGPEFAQTLASYIDSQDEEQILTKAGNGLQVMVTKSRREVSVNGRTVLSPCYGFKASMAFKQADGTPRIVQMEVTNGSSLWDVLAPAATKACKLNDFTPEKKEVAKAVSTLLNSIVENGHDGTELSIGVTAGVNGNNAGQVRTRLFLAGVTVVAEEDEWAL